MITGTLVLAAYCIYAYGKYRTGAIAADDLNFWAVTMLIFIGIGVVATIIIQIIFHIILSIAIAVKERDCDDKKIEKILAATVVEDEMDKLIELKASKIGFFFAGMGFVVSLVLLTLDYSSAVALNIMFLSYSIGSLLEGFISLHYYRKGVGNG